MNVRKITLILVCGVFSLWLFSFPVNVDAAGKMPKGTMVADFSVADKTESETKQFIETELATWQADDDLILKSDFEQLAIPRTVFAFDINKTIELLNERTKRTFTSLFMKQKNVHVPLVVTINENHEAIQSLKQLDYVDTDKVLEALRQRAKELNQSDINLSYIDDREVPLETIAEVELEIPDVSGAVLTYGVNELNGYLMEPNDAFSLLDVIEFPKSLTTSAEEISFLGSAMYITFLQTNFEIAERHPQATEISYAKPGLDVLVDQKKRKDLKVINPNDVAFKVEAEINDDHLQVVLKAAKTELSYMYELEKVEKVQQRTIYRYSKKLNPGEVETIQKGRQGLSMEVHRSTYEGGSLVDSEFISQDVYLPKPTIVLVSTEDPEAIEADDEVEVSEDETTEKVEDLEQSITDMDDTIEWIDRILASESAAEQPSRSTITEQLTSIKETQAELAEEITQLEKNAILSKEAMDVQEKAFEEKFAEINEQLENLLDHMLGEAQAEEEVNK